MAVNIGPKIGVDGEAEYRKQINNIITQAKTLSSEMKKLSSSFDGNNRSLQQNAEQHKLLQSQIKNQEERVSQLNAMLEKSKQKYGENATQTQKWQQAVNSAETDLNKLKGQLNNLPSSLDLVAAKFEALGNKIKTVGSAISNIGSKMTATLTVPIAGAGIKAASSFAEVDKTMQLTNSTMGNTVEQAKLLDDAMKAAAANSTFGMSDAANATLNFARAGLDAEQSAAALAPAMNLAAGEGGELDIVSAGLVATINGFGDSFDKTARYADVFASACNNSALDVNGLSESLSVAAPIFSAAGYKIEDATLYLGTMANAGIEASVAANSLKTGLARLVSPAKEGSEMMASLGIEVTNSNGTMKDAITIQQELHDTFAGLSESEQIAAASAIFGKNQMSQWLALINTAPEDVQSLAVELAGASINMDDFAKQLDNSGLSIEELQNNMKALGISNEAFEVSLKTANGDASLFAEGLLEAAESGTSFDDVVAGLGGNLETLQGVMDSTKGTTDSMANAMMSGFGGSIESLKSSIDVLLTSIGSLLATYLTPLIEKIQTFVNWLNSLSAEEQNQIVQMAALVAAIGPVLMIGGKIITGIGTIMTYAPQLATALQKISTIFGGVSTSMIGTLAPIIGITAAIGALVAAFVHLWNTNEQFRSNMTAIWEGIKSKFEGFISAVQERLPGIQEAFTNIVNVIKPIWEGFCATLAPIFEGAFTIISTIISTVLDVIIGILDVFVGIFTGDWEKAGNGAISILQALSTGITTIFNTISTTILNVLNTILGFFGTSLEGIKTKVTTAFQSIYTTISSKIGSVKTAVTTGFTNITTYLSGLPSKFRTYATQMVSSLASGVSSTISRVKTAFQSGLQGAINYVSGLPSSFFRWGSDMVSNLVSGINGMISNVASACSNLAGTIAKYLHFSEPDVGPLSNFNSWMPDMTSQMAKQIEAGRDRVQKAVAGLAADIALPMEGTINQNTMNYGGTTINVYGAEGQDIDELANEIQNIINNDIEQKGAVFA